jgi:hypothetical protein
MSTRRSPAFSVLLGATAFFGALASACSGSAADTDDHATAGSGTESASSNASSGSGGGLGTGAAPGTGGERASSSASSGPGGAGAGGAQGTGGTPSKDAGAPTSFVHPGILVGQAQLDFVKAKIAASAQPWTSGYDKAKGSHFASLSYTPAPSAKLSRNTSSADDIQADDIAAYTDALLWAYTGNAQYADEAIAIMNAWSSTLTAVDSTAQLDAAWASQMFPRAAEIIRYTYTPAAGHASLDVAAFSKMLVNVLLPQLDPTSKGATYSNGNWELSMADGTINIGVFTDDKATFDQGLAMWRARVPAYIYETSDGPVPVFPPGGEYSSDALVTCMWATGGDHTTTCALPAGFGFKNGMAQETCRDMSHVILAFEGMTNAAETARLQGVDLYGEQKDRIVAGYEFAAKYDLEALAAPNGTTKGSVGDQLCGGSLNYGGLGYTIGWELAYNEFAGRQGIAMPYTEQMIAKLSPTPAALDAAWETLTSPGTP